MSEEIIDEEEDLFLMTKEGKILEGGTVADEKKALSTRCHGYKGDTTELVWSPGIKGCLSKEEKIKYCRLGTDWRPLTEGLKRRWRALREAGVKFPKKKTGLGVGGEPRKGKPKTEEERKAEHLARFGSEKLPERGKKLEEIIK